MSSTVMHEDMVEQLNKHRDLNDKVLARQVTVP